MIQGKGAKTREQIIAKALHIAALEGLGALSIGRLAKELKMSKSGLFAHFGSKENLEKAVVQQASSLFFDHIVGPIGAAGLEGIERVWALCDGWLTFIEKRVIPGGYFFSGAFFQCAEQKGSIPNGIKRVARDWMDLLRDALHEARSQEEVRTDIDIKRTALELNGILLGAQWSGILGQSDPMSARRAILGSLGRVATDAISDEVFESVGTWRAHLERSC